MTYIVSSGALNSTPTNRVLSQLVDRETGAWFSKLTKVILGKWPNLGRSCDSADLRNFL